MNQDWRKWQSELRPEEVPIGIWLERLLVEEAEREAAQRREQLKAGERK